ncbi:MAG: hypothetical protein EAX86_13270 [Candidatus Heimdallarchaeota archaeon]|nr:hypothetical protein [Candidatus Heimdallarchaeota archaeon]
MKFIWKDWDWYSVMKLIFLLLAILIGEEIQRIILYPEVALIVSDGVIFLFQCFGFNAARIETPKGIGVVFYDHFNPTDVEVLHALMNAGCIVFSLFLALAMDYNLHNLKLYFIKDNKDTKQLIRHFLISGMVLILFFPSTFVRFLVILLIFLLLWNTPLWPLHYAIGHDLMGNWTLIFGTIILYCVFMYRDYWKTQISKTWFHFQSFIQLMTRSAGLIESKENDQRE